MANWIDSIHWLPRKGWRLEAWNFHENSWSPETLSVKSGLVHRGIELPEARSFHRSGCNLPIRIAALSDGHTLLSARTLIRQLLPGIPATKNHAIYRFEYEGRNFYVPALLLAGVIFGRWMSLRSLFLQPDFLSSIVRVNPDTETSGTPLVTISRSIPRGELSPGLLTLLAWLALSDEGQACVSSAYDAATEGRIDMKLPGSLAMNGWVWGIEMEHGVFVREFIGLSLHLDVDFEAVDFKIMKVNRKLIAPASLLYGDNAGPQDDIS
jgi:hypothetical protein